MSVYRMDEASGEKSSGHDRNIRKDSLIESVAGSDGGIYEKAVTCLALAYRHSVNPHEAHIRKM